MLVTWIEFISFELIYFNLLIIYSHSIRYQVQDLAGLILCIKVYGKVGIQLEK